MLKRLILPLLLAAISLSPIDYDRALMLRVESLMSFSHVASYRYLGAGWFELTDSLGNKWRKMMGDARTTGGLKPKKIITLDLRQIDTNGYSSMFVELESVHVGVTGLPPIAGYLGDSITILAGQYYIPGDRDPVRIYSKTRGEDSFVHVHSFKNGFFPNALTDLDKNGSLDLVADSLGSLMTYEQRIAHDLPIGRKLIWSGISGSLQVPRLFDFDGDGYQEIVLRQFGSGFLGTVVVKYDSGRKNLRDTYRITYPHNPDFRGYYAIGDFDKDGNGEFVTANRNGEVFFVEHSQGDSGYAISFSDTTRYINAFFHTEGNDLDGDGRPECFIGSDNTGGLNNIAVYETTGNNIFEVSLWIEIFPVGSFTWEWIWTGDVDGDKRNEIVLSSGNALVILKAFGDDDYRVIWYKRYNSEISHRLFDLDRDGNQEILLSFVDLDGSHKTKIISIAKTTSVPSVIQEPLSAMLQVYPNPANQSLILQVLNRGNVGGNVMIFSSSGAGVFHSTISAEKMTLTVQTSNWKQGVYFVTYANDRHRLTTKLLVLH